MKNINVFLSSCWWNYLNSPKNKRIQYLSPIPGSKPGWYFWLDQNTGVFELLLSKWTTEEEISSFSLKYYPSPDEDIFDTFSCAAQVVRLSDFFDNSTITSNHNDSNCACSQLANNNKHVHRTKGFPKFHARKLMNTNLFSIGEISIELQAGKLMETKLICQDQIIQYSIEGIKVPQQDGSLLQVLEPSSIDGNIPSWEIGWLYYDLLVGDVFSELGLTSKNFKRDVQPGNLFFQEKEGGIWTVESNTVTKITHTNYF